jgi:hypothetical protein
VTAAAVAKLHKTNPHVRVLRGAVSVGPDPVRAAVLRLQKLGVQFQGSRWPLRKEPMHLLSQEEIEDGPAPVIEWVLVPHDADLSDEDLALLANVPITFSVYLISKPDLGRYLRAISSQYEANYLEIKFAAVPTADELSQLQQLSWFAGLRLIDAGISQGQLDSLREAIPQARIFSSEFGHFEPWSSSH